VPWPVEVGVQLLRQQSEPENRTIHRAKDFLRKHARMFLRLKPGNRRQLIESPGSKYQKPVVRQIAPEQAKLFLIGRATIGDRGAKDLMEIVFLARSAQNSGPQSKGTVPAAAFNPAKVYGRRPAPDCP
jgi:hypothetical protein